MKDLRRFVVDIKWWKWFEEVDVLSETKRGTKGYGSTGR